MIDRIRECLLVLSPWTTRTPQHGHWAPVSKLPLRALYDAPLKFHVRAVWLVVAMVGCSLATAAIGTLLLAVIFVPWSGEEARPEEVVHLLRWWLHSPAYWIHLAVIVPLLVGTQILFLLPAVPMELRIGRVRSLRCSIILAGLIAAIMSVSLGMALVALVQWIFGWLDDFGMALFAGPEGVAMADPDLYADRLLLIPLIFLVVTWFVWSLVLGAFIRRGQPIDRLGRLVGLLLGGTMLELVLILPLEAMIRRRADCYCATGSFQGLIGGCIAALWLLGPMACIALIQRRPRWWARHCQRCGYAKSPASTERCPECGWGWNVDGPKCGSMTIHGE